MCPKEPRKSVADLRPDSLQHPSRPFHMLPSPLCTSSHQLDTAACTQSDGVLQGAGV